MSTSLRCKQGFAWYFSQIGVHTQAGNLCWNLMLLYGTSIIRLPDGLVSMMCNSDESNFHMLSTHPGCSRNKPLVPF